MHSNSDGVEFGDAEPTADDLAAIEWEWPLIAAECDLVLAEIRVLTAEPHPSALDWRRLRRAERAVVRAALELAAGQVRGPTAVAA